MPEREPWMAQRREPDLSRDEQALAVELTGLALARVAPDELVVLDDTAAEYFENPEELLRQDGGDSPLGSGITVAMMTPYLLAAAGVALQSLGAFAGEIAKGIAVDLAKEPATSWVRRLFKRHPAEPAEPAGPLALTREQAGHVRQAVVAKCYAIGLPSEQAALIADATVGALHVRP
jgi:hypothetical protein